MNWRRRQPEPPSALLQTMRLPNGQFMLVFSDMANSTDRNGVREAVDLLPRMTGAAAVIVFDGPVVVFNAEPDAPSPPSGLTVMESYGEAP
jgi:hypothetical protein